MTALTAKVAGVESVVATSSDDYARGGLASGQTRSSGQEATPSRRWLTASKGCAGRHHRWPSNRWVTAAKALVVGRVGIDMLAGPSELCRRDDSADPKRSP